MIHNKDLGLVYRAPNINGDPRLVFPRENLDYAKYYEIKIIPCLDAKEYHQIDPIFDNLFHVYTLTFKNFLDYLQAFNDGRAWMIIVFTTMDVIHMCIYIALMH